MKKITPIIITGILTTIGITDSHGEEPSPPKTPAIVQLAATDFESVDPGHELDTYQRAAIEVKDNAKLLASADKIDVAGFSAVEVKSSLECGLLTYQDNSFTALPAGTPYDASGNEIDVDYAEITDESPISLKVYLAQAGTASGQSGG